MLFLWVSFSLPVAVEEAPGGFGVSSWPPMPSFFFVGFEYRLLFYSAVGRVISIRFDIVFF